MNQIFGVAVALVTDVNDEKQQGRVRLHYPWLADDHQTDWVRIATMMGGHKRGSFFMPEVGDEALVAFEHGDPSSPIVIGFLWNGKDAPPATHVRERRLQSRNGHCIRFLDSTPQNGDLGALIVQDGHGNKIVMNNTQIVITAKARLRLHASQIILEGDGYTRTVGQNSNPI